MTWHADGAGAGASKSSEAPAEAPSSSSGAEEEAPAARAPSSFPPHQVLTMPALSPTMDKGNVVKWAKQVGDEVLSGDLLVEIETDKVPVAAPAALRCGFVWFLLLLCSLAAWSCLGCRPGWLKNVGAVSDGTLCACPVCFDCMLLSLTVSVSLMSIVGRQSYTAATIVHQVDDPQSGWLWGVVA